MISNNANAYALERARKHGIEARCISPKQYETREAFNEALLAAIQSYGVDLVVLAGCLVVIPEIMVKAYPNTNHQHSSGADPVFLRNRLLWTESS